MSPATNTKAPRVRLDQLLVDRGLAESRSRAQAAVMAGSVRVGDGDAARTDRKPGDLLDPATAIAVVRPEPFVSRGGHKLAAALDAFGVDPSGRVCLDVGASTGGFTDVLLQRGAARVVAIDVGRGQLAERLRADPRVDSLERVNARDLTPARLPAGLPAQPTLATVDVSFIGLGLVLGPIAGCLGQDDRSELIALVKPQFEAGRGQTDRGVVRDPAIHRAVVEHVVETAEELGLGGRDVIPSPIRGPAGNREFLVHFGLGSAAPDLARRIAEATAP